MPIEVLTDPVASSRLAGLRYVTDARPGIARKRRGKGFRYVAADGSAIKDEATLARIKSLVIPPAWKDVWICPLANGHLQATGRDARGRKQSRYHPRWREVRDENKYERMKAFADALPAIRLQVEHDLSLPGLPREKILATIVRLLETTFIRVGNEEYARQNRSYGLTTMRNRHVDVTGATVHFKFQGKSGVHHTIDLNDRRLARIVKRCLDVPGYELFQYLDDEGAHHAVDAADVNDYLRSIASEQFTAKDFRTWAGTVLACSTLRAMGEFASATEGKRNIVRAIATVAQRLGNTPSVCRKCYIHPTVIACYLDGGMTKALARKIRRHKPVSPHALLEEELHLVRLLENAVKSAA